MVREEAPSEKWEGNKEVASLYIDLMHEPLGIDST